MARRVSGRSTEQAELWGGCGLVWGLLQGTQGRGRKWGRGQQGQHTSDFRVLFQVRWSDLGVHSISSLWGLTESRAWVATCQWPGVRAGEEEAVTWTDDPHIQTGRLCQL